MDDLQRRRWWAWCLYDFGNSAFAVLFSSFYGVYFTSKVVTAGGGWADQLWSWVLSGSMLLVAVTAPFFGGIADLGGARRRMLLVFSALGIAAVLAFTLVEPGFVVLGFIVGLLANFAFEAAIVFYNAWLPDLARPQDQGRLSARGFAVGYAGSLVALGYAAALFMAGAFSWIWSVLCLQWAIGTWLALRGLPADLPGRMGVLEAGRQGLRRTLDSALEIWRLPNLRRFLLANFLYINGVLTLITFASIYASKTLGFTGIELIYLIGIVQLTALVGSIASAPPAERYGPRRVLLALLAAWSSLVVFAAFLDSKWMVYVAAGLAGLGLGSVQSISRALMARLIPDRREAEFFGFYALCGKTGAVLGPLVFGGVVLLTGGDQRPAMASLIVFFVSGAWLLKGVDDSPVPGQELIDPPVAGE